MTVEIDLSQPGASDTLLRALTAPYRGLSAKLDAELDRDIASAKALGATFEAVMNHFPARVTTRGEPGQGCRGAGHLAAAAIPCSDPPAGPPEALDGEDHPQGGAP